MPWKVNDLMSQRYDFCHLALSSGVNFSDLCREFAISRQTGYKWLQRYQEEGDSGLNDRSRRPLHSPGCVAAALEEGIVSLRQQYPYYGPRKLRRLLRDQLPGNHLPAVITVARILRRHELTGKSVPRLGLPAWQRFAAPQPNDLWQMDLKGALKLPDGCKLYPTGLLDDHSRYLLGLWALSDQSDDRLLSCWIETARHFGLPQRTLTDHGAQFRSLDEETSAFRVYLHACGVRHIQGRIAHPQTQGKVERFWRTLNLEVLCRHEYRDVASWQSCLDDWRQHYNCVRPHQELGDEPPVSRYQASDRIFVEPDRRLQTGSPESLYRHVKPKGDISLGGQRVTVGRGYAGWTVEVRPLGHGCWHVYFRDHFVKEFILTDPLPRKRRG